MLRKLGIGLVVVAAVAVIGNLQGKEPKQGHRLREYFKTQFVIVSLPFLRTELVQNDLKMTDAQKEKTAPLQAEMKKSIGNIFTENPNLTPDERRKRIEQIYPEIEKKLEEILQPHQIDRLLEIITQWGGHMLLSEIDIGKILELTDDQREKIKAIADDAKKSIAKAMENRLRVSNKDDIKKEIKERMKMQQPILNEANEKVLEILTPKQSDMLNKMKGKEVDTAKLFEEFTDAIEFP